MPRCSAADCKQMGSHTFPKDPNLRRLWERATNKENFKASKHSRLCSGHFKESDYVQVCVTTGLAPFHKYLKKTAIPSIFAWNNENRLVSKEDARTSRNAMLDTLSKDKLRNRRICAIHFPLTSFHQGNMRSRLIGSAVPVPFHIKNEMSDDEMMLIESQLKKHVIKKSVSQLQNVIRDQENKATEKTKLRDRSVRLRNRKAFLANRRCSVPQCNTRPSNEISLHPCPNNAAVRDEWAEALKVSRQYIKNMVACSLHFSKIDFIQSKSAESKVLKQNAVPSRNLPQRKRVEVSNKDRVPKKPFKAVERPKTMTDPADGGADIQEENIRECRACLKKLDDKKSLCNVFQAWAPPWSGMEATIAEDLAKLANVEISVTDRHSKVICLPCYQTLLDAASFAASVRECDLILRQRFTDEIDMERVWPKPIQVDKNINGSVFNSTLDVEIKQEVVSDEEQTDVFNTDVPDNTYVDTELSNLDIKIEPEEIIEPPPMNITINGTISLDPLNSENKALLTNGTESYQDDQSLDLLVKQEPMSEEEEVEQGPDLSLDCILCTKTFNSVTGLKAHVIAQHSYKTVKRKSGNSISPEKKRSDRHRCAICRRSFQTSTDLMVHETCHNKHACYGCTQKFDSFEQLTRHRKLCKASLNNSVQKLKTLEDVKRTMPEGKPNLVEVEIEKELIENQPSITTADSEMTDVSENIEGISENTEEIKIKEEDTDSNMKLHLEIHSTQSEKETVTLLDGGDVQVEKETLLNEGDAPVETLKNDDCI